jgi:HEAT repeat protein
MRQSLFIASCAISVAASSSMQASNVEQVSEAARPAYQQLFASDAAERCKGAHEVVSLGPADEPTIERLVKLLTDDATFEEIDSNGHVWTFTPAECAEHALIAIGEPAVARVIPFTRHSDPTVRRRAVFVLGRSQDPRAVEPLLAAFRDRDVVVRRAAVMWAGNSDPRFFDAYVRALEDRDSQVRIQAGRRIGALQDARAVDVLLRNLSSHDVDIQTSAAMSLGQRKDPRITPALIAALRDPSGWVQSYAALALGELKDPDAVEPLLALVRETPDNSARFAFIEALGKIGDARAYETLISCLQGANFVTRKQAVDALLSLGDPRAADSIRPLLKDPQPAVRESAQKALSVLGSSPRPVSQ